MKKYLIITAAATGLMFSACSNDEPLAQNLSQDAISYEVVTNNHSRAAHSYGSSNLPPYFNVWAINNNNISEPYINNATIIKSNGAYIDGSGTRIWPATGNLDFYALVDHLNKFKFTEDNGDYYPEVVNYGIGGMSDPQLDLMYAVHTSAKKEDGAVTLNFKHALCQVAFKAENENPNTKIHLMQINVSGIHSKGTYRLPKYGNTTIGYVNENGYLTDYDNHGFWKDLSGNADASTLPIPSSNVFNYEYALNLIPQTKTAAEGFKFILKGYMNEYSSSNLFTVEIPADIAWEEGKRYIYTFKFDKYWTPDDPNISPITYEVSCDDFITEDEVTVPEDNGVLMREANGNEPALYFATKNIGAEKPEDIGLFFWWGDTKGHAVTFDGEGNGTIADGFSFSSENPEIANFGMKDSSLDDWYNQVTINGNLKPEYDAAVQHWGGPWRMPTKADLDWLINKENCDWFPIVEGDDLRNDGKTIGVYVVSKSTGGIIYLPSSTGFCEANRGWYIDEYPYDMGGTWTSTAINNANGSKGAYAMFYKYEMPQYATDGERVDAYINDIDSSWISTGINIRPCYTK